MSNSIIYAASFVAFAALAGAANAQGLQLNNDCLPTGLTPDGKQCVQLYEVDRAQTAGQRVAGLDNIPPVDPNTLAQTYLCDERREGLDSYGRATGEYVENCGAPIQFSESELTLFNGTTAPVPASAPVAVAPPPPPAPVVAGCASCATYGAVPFQAAGLSNGALLSGAVGAAALAGLIAVVASGGDDDDDNGGGDGDSSTTTTTN